MLPPLLEGRCVTVPQFRARVRRAAMALDPVTAEERHLRALADRTVGYVPGDDGMVSMPVVLGAPEAQLIFTRLTAAATLLPATDPRTMDQKRADLLVDAVLSGFAGGRVAGVAGPPALDQCDRLGRHPARPGRPTGAT